MRILSRRAVVFALVVLALSSAAFGQLRIAVTFGPPPIPIYDQPICPGDGYIWVPGYWAWDDDAGDYYWVPGTWVLAPEVGFFWTPPYWAWVDGAFVFYDGWWGPHVGFYGGINYGFGYFGEGFVGGRWEGGHFFYNREVMNVNITEIHNVYNERVTINENRVSYNGGNGGVIARPTREEESYAHERHIAASAAQVQHMQAARGNPELRASANHGRPPIAATARPGAFSGREANPARSAGGAYNPHPNRERVQPRTEGGGHPAVHPNELPPAERFTPPNTGNAEQDRKYQQQQDRLQQKQQQERENLQRKQEQEHQRAAQQHANEASKQQMEQKHQQQTERLQQRHTQQRQQLQERQAPRSAPSHK